MFLLAGLLGLMAVGSVAFLGDFSGTGEEDDSALAREADTGGAGNDIMDDLVGDTGSGDTDGDTGDGGAEDVANLILPGDGNDNTLFGGAGDDQINGYGGDDLIGGGDGRDDLYGATGQDEILGGDGRDFLHGGDGNDVLSGDAGDDRLFGGNDNDTLSGGAGDDELQGGDGDDRLLGGTGDDALLGGLGNDILDGGAGQDTLFGGWGDDLVSGLNDGPAGPGDAPDAASDFLNGGGGDDTILAGEGDIVTAGDGADTIVMGEWVAGGEAVELMDYDPDEDRLVLVYDLTATPDPDIEVVSDPDTPGISRVLVEGDEIARVHGNVTIPVRDIVLVDFSDAPAFGLNAV